MHASHPRCCFFAGRPVPLGEFAVACGEVWVGDEEAVARRVVRAVAPRTFSGESGMSVDKTIACSRVGEVRERTFRREASSWATKLKVRASSRRAPRARAWRCRRDARPHAFWQVWRRKRGKSRGCPTDDLRVVVATNALTARAHIVCALSRRASSRASNERSSPPWLPPPP